jgi:hypothetical protein
VIDPQTYELYDAFEDCLARMLAGEPAEGCLARYPDLAGELRPMLVAASAARAAGQVPRGAEARSRARFLAAASGRRAGGARRAPSFAGLLRGLAAMAAVLVVGLLGGLALYFASAPTLPGDPLYGVKREFEAARLQLVSGPAERLALEAQLDARRAGELRHLLAAGRAGTVRFAGPLGAFDAQTWQVGDFTVQLAPGTPITGTPRADFYVRVDADVRDGIITARALDVVDEELAGALGGGGAEWALGGARFAVTPDTAVTGRLVPGAEATARVRRLGDGILVALWVSTEATVTPTSIPSPTLAPSMTPTPQPSTPAPSETHTPTPTATPQPPSVTASVPPPTATPAPSDTPLPTEPPEPPDPTQPPEPTQTPQPTEPPGPTNTAEPAHTPEPTEWPKPSPTAEPSHTPDGASPPTPLLASRGGLLGE